MTYDLSWLDIGQDTTINCYRVVLGKQRGGFAGEWAVVILDPEGRPKNITRYGTTSTDVVMREHRELLSMLDTLG